MTKIVVGFDLDDTLIPEVLFLKSGIRHIAGWIYERHPGLDPQRVIACMDTAVLTRRNHYSALECLIEKAGLTGRICIKEVVDEFRNHKPDPEIYHVFPSIVETLYKLKKEGTAMVLITDGRSTTQRNKIEAAGLYRFFDNENIFISGETGFDKTNPDNFLSVMRKYAGAKEYHYVGDNPKKDFLHPSRLGWQVHLVHPFPLAVHQGIPR